MHSLVTMGFFSKGEPVVDPPNKTKRKVCWDSRDKFFDCLAKNKIENSLDPKLNEQVESSCGGERVEFQDNCVASWFKYFQEKRYNDISWRQKVPSLCPSSWTESRALMRVIVYS